FFFQCYVDHRDLHSFPTRRSSDLRIFLTECRFGIDSQGRIAGSGSELSASHALESFEGENLPASGLSRSHIVKKNPSPAFPVRRSEEHTSELQSLRHLVCRLLLEK